MTETTERFLREIAARVGEERVVELHLFPALRQGGTEAGLAVVAAAPEPEPVQEPEPEQIGAPEPGSPDPAEGAPFTPTAVEVPDDVRTVAEEASDTLSMPRQRHVVYTARYRHAIKGTDRGKWETSITAEADAPLVTVDEVVRGVVRRAGDGFAPERISGDQFRAILRSPGARASVPA